MTISLSETHSLWLTKVYGSRYVRARKHNAPCSNAFVKNGTPDGIPRFEGSTDTSSSDEYIG